MFTKTKKNSIPVTMLPATAQDFSISPIFSYTGTLKVLHGVCVYVDLLYCIPIFELFISQIMHDPMLIEIKQTLLIANIIHNSINTIFTTKENVFLVSHQLYKSQVPNGDSSF